MDEDNLLSKTYRLDCHSWHPICDNAILEREFRKYMLGGKNSATPSGLQALEEYNPLLRSNCASLTSSYHRPWMRKHGDDPWSWCADRAHEFPSSGGDPCEGAHASFAQCPQGKHKEGKLFLLKDSLQLGMLMGFGKILNFWASDKYHATKKES